MKADSISTKNKPILLKISKLFVTILKYTYRGCYYNCLYADVCFVRKQTAAMLFYPTV